MVRASKTNGGSNSAYRVMCNRSAACGSIFTQPERQGQTAAACVSLPLMAQTARNLISDPADFKSAGMQRDRAAVARYKNPVHAGLRVFPLSVC